MKGGKEDEIENYLSEKDILKDFWTPELQEKYVHKLANIEETYKPERDFNNNITKEQFYGVMNILAQSEETEWKGLKDTFSSMISQYGEFDAFRSIFIKGFETINTSEQKIDKHDDDDYGQIKILNEHRKDDMVPNQQPNLTDPDKTKFHVLITCLYFILNKKYLEGQIIE